MGAFTGPLKFTASMVVIFGLAAGAVKGCHHFLVKPNVDADNDGEATMQEYGKKTVDLLGDLTESTVEFMSGAADQAPEAAQRVLDKVEQEFDVPAPDLNNDKAKTLRNADDWRKGLCQDHQSDQECIEAAFDRLEQ